MGSGKTTVGKLLAKKLALPFIDLDEYFITQTGFQISRFFDLFGEARFREEETKVLKACLDQPGIIATGGGVVLSKKNRDLLNKQENVIWLKTEFEQNYQRLSEDTQTNRPIFKEKTELELKKKFFQRKSYYQETATRVIEINQLKPVEIMNQIINN